MKTLTVKITEEEHEQLTRIAKENNMSKGALLAAFIADLTWSDRSGGSDERMYASDWLYRQCFSFR